MSQDCKKTDFKARAVEKVLNRRNDSNIEWVADLLHISNILQVNPQIKTLYEFEVIFVSAMDMKYLTIYKNIGGVG